MRYPRNVNSINNAKDLRKNMTPQERHLWYDFLRYVKPRFRRQELVGSFIADFFCYKASLAIEIDGSQHYEADGKYADIERTSYFHSLGIKVLRFSNADVNTRFDGVCNAILIALEQCGIACQVLRE